MAPEPLYNNIRAIVDKLDVRRAQIYVEALVVEVSPTRPPNSASSGRSARRRQDQQRRDAGRAAAPISARAAPAPTSSTRRRTWDRCGQGLNLGHHPRDDQHPGARHDHQPRPARARAGDRRQHQHPVDAEPADAGQRGGEDRRRPERAVHYRPVRDRPAPTTTVTPFQTIERKDVGLTLKVKPQITEGGTRPPDDLRRRSPASKTRPTPPASLPTSARSNRR